MTRKFSAAEYRYLLTLPAVEQINDDHITYAAWFRADCMRRYRTGESPLTIFKNVGLDPELIGTKRIEHCIERWHNDKPATLPKPLMNTMEALDRLTAEIALQEAQHFYDEDEEL